jgi:head-tail adaptor
MQIKIGRLKHYVELQSKSSSQDAMGGDTETWSKVTDFYASIQAETAKEIVSGDQVHQEVTYIIRTRAVGLTITPSMQIVWGSRVFKIVSAINAQERDIMLEILAIEDLNAN